MITRAFSPSVGAGVSSNVYDLGAGGTADDTAALTAGMTALASTGGTLLGRPNTTYTFLDVTWAGSNIALAGAGPSTIFKMIAGTTANHYLLTAIGSTTAETGNLTGLGLRDCQLLGTVTTDAFVQSRHLLALGGVSGMTIDNVLFKGFQGDGIYLGHPGGNERHNRRVTITRCTFDGVNQDNRNAISIIDGEDILIQGNNFMNTTRTDMPGAIDIEPNAGFTWAVLRNIRIVGNGFRNIRAGIAGVVAYVGQVAQASLTTPMSGLVIADNTFVDCPNANASIYLTQNQTLTSTTRKNNVVVANNTAYTSGKPYEIDGVRGVQFSNNTWENAWNGPAIGFTNACRDITVHGDTYDTIGGSNGIVVYKVVDLSLVDCDWIAAGSTQVFRFAAGSGSVGSSDKVDVVDNRIKGSGPTAVVLKDAAHTVTSTANNRAMLSRWNGLSTTAVANVFGVTANNL